METKYPTLAGIMQGHSSPLEKKVVETVLYDMPLIKRLPSKVISGTTYKQKRRVSLPLIGAAPYNTGVGVYKTNYEVVNAEVHPYQGMFIVDKKMVNGERELLAQYMHEEMLSGVRGALANLERSVIYGSRLNPHGMLGLMDVIGDYMTISATGKHDSRVYGGCSVWALSLGQEGPQVVWGNKKTIAFGPQYQQAISMKQADGSDGLMPAYIRDMDFHVGFSQMDPAASACLVNEGADNPLTDKLLAKLVECFPADRQPNLLVMNRHSLRRLREQRTVGMVYPKAQSKGGVIADKPVDFDGIPIICTDMLLADETLENIAALGKLTELRAQKNTANLIR